MTEHSPTFTLPLPVPPAHHTLTVIISTSYPTPCFIYVVCSGPLWPTFHHCKFLSASLPASLQPTRTARLQRERRMVAQEKPSYSGVTFATWCSPYRLRKKQLPYNSHWSGPPPTTPNTNSQSPLKAIERRSPVIHHLRSLLSGRAAPTTLLWKPGHKGISGNEFPHTAGKTTATTAGHLKIDHQHPRGQQRCMVDSPRQQIAWPLTTECTLSSLSACEPVTLHC